MTMNKKTDIRMLLANLAPLAGLVLLLVVYLILAWINGTNISYGLKNIINQSVIVITAATGAVFIYAIGSFDISLGASLCFSAITGAMAFNATQSILVMALVCIGVAIFISLVNSTLATVFNLPVFVTTIAMLSLLNALILVLIGANGSGDIVKVPAAAVTKLNTMWFRILVMVIYLAFSIFIFNFLRQGRDEKLLGGNIVCAKLSGVNTKSVPIIAFVMAGLGVGLAAFLQIIYAPTLSRTTASSVGMDVIMAIVFGGMPVSGGAKSKIHVACIGTFSMVILSQIMQILSLDTGIGQMVKAVIFLAVVFISMANNKKILAR